MGNGNRHALGEGVSFSKWKSSLQAKLAKRNLLGHVFHDIEEIEPAIAPEAPPPMSAEQTPQQYQELVSRYRSERAAWKIGEIEARNIIIDRLSDSVCPQTYERYTAKQLYESVAKTRSESATVPYSSALETLLQTKYTGSPNDYCDRFLANLQSVNSAAEALVSNSSTLEPAQSEYAILPGQAAVLFSLGTKGVGWLDNWRDTKALESDNKFSSLEFMMSSLRTVAGNRTQPTPRITAAAEVGTNDKRDPDDYCTLCLHKHKNKQCFKQHPELAKARRGNQGRRDWKGKGKARSLAGECNSFNSDSDSEGTAIAAMCASRSNIIPSLYDTGASY